MLLEMAFEMLTVAFDESSMSKRRAYQFYKLFKGKRKDEHEVNDRNFLEQPTTMSNKGRI